MSTSTQQAQIIQRLLRRDASLWTRDQRVAAAIEQRLGWLNAPAFSLRQLDRISAFVDHVRSDQINRVLLLGMGGSSLSAEVLARSFGAAPGYPPLTVMDSTSPDTVGKITHQLEGKKPLFIVASKSGTTAETAMLEQHFRQWAQTRFDQVGPHFAAITDPGSELARRATAAGYRELFLNPDDIGGRYSALSFFGLVPAALLGIDIERVAELSRAVVEPTSVQAAFAVTLGTFLGDCARQGKNKLTLVLAPDISALGVWIEQLVAESTGKQGRGIIPIDGETLMPVQHYQHDRVFILIEMEGQVHPERSQVDALTAAGHPVYRWQLQDRCQLGAEFMRWQIATAVASAIIGVNPFDEPDVNETKEHTRKLLAARERSSTQAAAGLSVAQAKPALITLLAAAPIDGYIAIIGYLPDDEEVAAGLRLLRTNIMHRCRRATMLCIGPRYLHSTGQLHKGGPENGTFIVFTCNATELDIPGQEFGFQRFIAAQAQGDMAILTQRGRRLVHVELGDSVGAHRAIEEIARALRP